MAEVQGIGGVFIDSNDASRLARWYEEVLGIKMETHPDGIGFYKVFFTRDADSNILRENPVFAINSAAEPLVGGVRGLVINLRVDDLYAVLEALRAQGVEPEGELLEWERGKHARIRDLDGNLIELYEEVL